MEQIATLTNRALTVMQEPTTKDTITPQQREKFADWLKFKTFGDPELEKVVDACSEWGNALRAIPAKQPFWLTITGTSGTGKTHCARQMFFWAIKRFDWAQRAFMPHVIYWPDFIQQLRGGNAFDLRNDLKEWPVVFLDDIGAVNESAFSFDELHTLLGCREHKWTIITSNQTLAALGQQDARIESRLVRGHNIVLEVKTKDYSLR